MDCGVQASKIGWLANYRGRGRASMNHLIISADLRTDLTVTTAALGFVAICAVIPFVLGLVIAPF
jgi:hypothetical protein